MARGWESKSVESQIEAAGYRRASSKDQVTATDALLKSRERESLLLSRTRVQHDLDTATNQRYREVLQAALRHLDQKIDNLG
jgi:hypothetical protein